MNIEYKYCPCGFPVKVCPYFWDKTKIIFRATDNTLITHCPNCRKKLEKEVLLELGELK